MTSDDLAAALQAAGFLGVDQEGGIVFARAGGPAAPEFQARFDTGWHLSLSRPLRAPLARITAWNMAHPDAPLDIHHGETRLTLSLHMPLADQLQRWARLAEGFTAQSVLWRRAQRAGGEGM